jgi:fatty-acid desaturase
MEGTVHWSPIKSLWFTAHAAIAIVGGYLTFTFPAALFSCCFTMFTLCLGHSIGLHRLLIHRSFACPRWLEYFLVHLGTIVGMNGPMRILYMHDIRDWSQRQSNCHAFFIDQKPMWRDFFWQTHCECKLVHPPHFQIEARVAEDRCYRFMQQTWMLQQLPWAMLFYLAGGWGFVIWGISVRIVISLIGHWLVGYLPHNYGQRDWHLQNHAVQGFNIPPLALVTMGEAWHNNHHAFPGSARLGLTPLQLDPGWWAIRSMKALHLVWNIRLPENLPARKELVKLRAVDSKAATADRLPALIQTSLATQSQRPGD